MHSCCGVFRLSFVPVLAAAVVGWAVPSACQPFTVQDNRIVDAHGREVLFHGVNVVYKSSPYIPITDHFHANRSFAEDDAKLLNSLGLNVIRLGAQWPGVEPARGQYSQPYVDKLAAIVDLCHRYNISVFLDAHQDCFSERFCGEGVPLWVARANSTFPVPLELRSWGVGDRGVPTNEQCAAHSWGDYQFSYAGAEGYESLYTNEDGFADAFAGFWAYLGAAMKGKPNVLAFELLNEPFAGNYFKDPLLMYPGHADKKRLQPFYDHISPTIRGSDPDRLLMFEPCTWTDEYGMEMFDSGFEHAPGGPDHANHSIFAYHYYANVNRGDPDKYMALRRKDMERLGTAGFVTETSASVADLDLMDRHSQSWAVWEYKSFLPLANETDLVPVCTGCGSVLWPDGKYDPSAARLLSRTYPQAVQGRLQSLAFNDTTSVFHMSYTADSGVRMPTQIFLNEELRYPSGFDVLVSPADPAARIVKTTAKNFVFLSLAAANRTTTSVDVTIRPTNATRS